MPGPAINFLKKNPPAAPGWYEFKEKLQYQHQAGMSFKTTSIPTPGWYEF
jgi:hypothetical protein